MVDQAPLHPTSELLRMFVSTASVAAMTLDAVQKWEEVLPLLRKTEFVHALAAAACLQPHTTQPTAYARPTDYSTHSLQPHTTQPTAYAPPTDYSTHSLQPHTTPPTDCQDACKINPCASLAITVSFCVVRFPFFHVCCCDDDPDVPHPDFNTLICIYVDMYV